ncbi:uncharacterized protein MKZ38_010331 [Zalerion maritima]|uniref:non-specific serine/threonine protein kinase n=1 Tax=Zalerion maritima TaxID=339359 RepID=A0AAD5WXT4_9PEZI|nr:uncharacterized protein MKZ38_010331 [Zalerion maritima]
MAGRSSASNSSRRSRDGVIGDFTIGAEIGKGSFAQVYLGKHKKTNEAVAIKSVELQRLNKKLKDNLRSEIRILTKLRHPHIVALHQCLESSTHINLIMEYCELGDLSLFIKKREKLITHPVTHDMARKYPSSPNAGLHEVISRHFLKQLASALKFLRSENLVHRDVKPQNLLLLPPRSYREANKSVCPILTTSENSLSPVAGLVSLPMLKLADFGFARVLPSTTLAETLCGSPLYMAPEILRYEKYDATADLWSVGTVLYEMVSGRAPFRANNHVELLRKIEAAEDVIGFPREVTATPQMKALVRSLLKRNPAERMSFEDFFTNIVVTGDIPGLVGDDCPSKPKERRPSVKQIPNPPPTDDSESNSSVRRLSITRRYTGQASVNPSSLKTGRSPPRSGAVEASPSSIGGQLSSRSPQTRQEGLGIRSSLRGRGSSNPTSNLKTPSKTQLGPSTEAIAAQDVMLEREYVLIDKNQVEYNAFADQLAVAGKVSRSPKSKEIVRRSTGPARIITQQPIPGQRPGFFEKGHSGSPTSVITKAIHDASLRLFGFKNPQLFLSSRTGNSPPQGYGPFPTFQAMSMATGVLGDGKASVPIDEENRVAQRIEETATLSDVVFGFAEVKYKQLVPLAPSMEHGLGGVPADQMTGEDEGLTVDAIVTLSEEALLLYMKSLTLLAKAMNIAGAWWSRKSRGDGTQPAQSLGSSSADKRVISAVQWTRGRFNEVLEKAELSKLKLQEAQKRLSPDHLSHPNNHVIEPASTSDSATDGVFITPGLSAGKLMYERAVEMSRSAAINEVTNQNLEGCELNYVTALRMLEAVLDAEEDFPRRRPSTPQREEKGDTEAASEIDIDDQQSVQKVMRMIKGRLLAVRNKRQVITSAQNAEKAEQQELLTGKRSGNITPRSVRSHTSS